MLRSLPLLRESRPSHSSLAPVGATEATSEADSRFCPYRNPAFCIADCAS
jgi:hypothetical protein